MAVDPSSRATGAHPAWPAWLRVVVLVSVVLTAAHLLMLVLQIPALMARPGWFWRLGVRETPDAALLLPLIVGVGAVARWGLWTRRTRERGRGWLARGWRGGVLVGTALGVMLGLSLVEGRGLDGLGTTLMRSGHAEFVHLAVARDQIDAATVVGDYERAVRELGLMYARTKPPGLLLVYIGVERAVNLGVDPGETALRLQRLVSALTVLFPLMSALTVAPLLLLARRWLTPSKPTIAGDSNGGDSTGGDSTGGDTPSGDTPGGDPAVGAALLYILAPNAVLVTMHLDGALYPSLALIVLGLWDRAVARGSVSLALASGLAFFVATYVSFSLLPVAMLLLAPLMLSLRAPGDPNRLLRLGAAWLAGLLLPLVLVRVGTGYDVWARLQDSLDVHQRFKVRPAGASNLDLAVTNLIEWAVWIGLPLCTAQLVGTARAMMRLLRGEGEVLDGIAVLLAGLLLLLSVEAQGETARLWLFLLPVTVMVARHGLGLVPAAHRVRTLAVMLLLQATILLATKKYQDFF